MIKICFWGAVSLCYRVTFVPDEFREEARGRRGRHSLPTGSSVSLLSAEGEV